MKFRFDILIALLCFISISANDIAFQFTEWEKHRVEGEIPSENNSEKETKEKSEMEEEDKFLTAHLFSDYAKDSLNDSGSSYGYIFRDSYIREIPSPPPDLV